MSKGTSQKLVHVSYLFTGKVLLAIIYIMSVLEKQHVVGSNYF